MVTIAQNSVQFYLNDERLVVQCTDPMQSLLSYLRDVRRLTGTKEGCAEGDCGACSVVMADLQDGQVRFRAINACIIFLPMVHGSAIYTIEYLARLGKLHPIQQALVETSGAQCGFCTPGIIMSLYAWSLNDPSYDRNSIENALQGNLCRCTGYRPIIEGVLHAEEAISSHAQAVKSTSDVQTQLQELGKCAPFEIVSDESDDTNGASVPQDIERLVESLRKFPDARLINGATDVGLWVNKHFREFSHVIFLSKLARDAKISVSESEITVDAFMSISEAQAQLSPYLPDLAGFWTYFAGQQVRNFASIGGNIANASPIGDSLPIWLALDAEISLLSHKGTRRIRLDEFFIEYGKTALEAGECVYRLHIPRVDNGRLRFYKISKRKYEDISSVFGAIRIAHSDGVISHCRIAFGGMAGTPMRARKTEDFLTGKPFTTESTQAAMHMISKEFSPLSDHRASSDYRMKTAQNMLMNYYLDEIAQA